ncbi:MAG: oligosaccharide flippase family protein [Pseudomonadota bacterium]
MTSRFDKSFRNNLIVMVKSGLVVQALPFILAPVLSRLYTPDDFGIYTFATAVIAGALSFSTFRFEWLIPSADDSRSVNTLVTGSLLAAIVFSFACTVFFMSGLWESIGDETQEIGDYVLLITACIFLASCQNILYSLFIRTKELTPNAIARILQSGSQSTAQVALGLLSFGPLGLITSSLIQYMTGTFYLFSQLRRLHDSEKPRLYLKFPNLEQIRSAAAATLVSVANIGTVTILPLAYLDTYGVMALGLYGFVTRLALAPSRLFTQAISQSFWAEAADLVNKDCRKLRKLYLGLIKTLSIYSLPVLALLLIASTVFDTVFGEEWGQSGKILVAISPYIIANFIFTATNHLVVYNKQSYQLISDLSGLILAVGIVYLSKHLQLEFHWTVFYSSLALSLGYLLRFYLHLVANRVFDSNKRSPR